MTSEALTVAVFLDYQNMHLTGHGKFAPAADQRHTTLVHPLHLANQIMATRRVRQGTGHQPCRLERVVAYRGLPGNAHEPNSYRRSQAQRSEWTKDRRVDVVYRPLKYPSDWPGQPAQEKGIDVLIALGFVRAADRHVADVVILGSHDTDLEPAVAAAEDASDVIVETAGWTNCRRLRGGSDKRWHTFLDGRAFVACHDLKQYP